MSENEKSTTVGPDGNALFFPILLVQESKILFKKLQRLKL